MKSFIELGLSKKNIQVLQKKGFEEPTEIQALTIPLLLKNQIDIIAQAQTGTGKTAAFALPLIENLEQSTKKVLVLILTPTRELAIQVCEEINSLRGNNNISVAPVYGGQSITLQLKKLKRGVNIVVGTPGRILDHIRRKTLDLHAVQYFILDEADEMLNMGFIEDIETIFDCTPREKRVLLLSATMPNIIKKLAEKYMGKYTHIKTKTQLATSLADQIYFEVEKQDKFEALSRIIDIERSFYGIVFCRTKVDVDNLATQLFDRGYSVDALHGDISQRQREKTLDKLKRKQLSVLIATDVAARGIDVSNLSHVINYSIPQDPEAYIHRIGRTGRAGKQGTAITFVTSSEFRKLGFIKRVANVNIRKQNIPEISDIISVKKKKISEDIESAIRSYKMDEYREWAKVLINKNPAEDVIAGILKYSFGKTFDKSSYRDLTPTKNKRRGNTLVEAEGKTRLFIAKGEKNSNMTKEKLINFIVNQAGTPRKYIDNVEVYEEFSFITVPFAEAEIILKKFRNVKNRNRAVVVKAKARRKRRTK